MSVRAVFLDTNILIYQLDKSDPAKQIKAHDLIRQNLNSGKAVISSQVAQEFINVAFSKFSNQVKSQDFNSIMQDLIEPLCEHFPSMAYYRRAVGLYLSHDLHFYDALIIQAALDLGCETLYSEELQDGQKFGNLKVVNPFKD